MGWRPAVRVLALAGVLLLGAAPAASADAGEGQPSDAQVQAALDRAAALHRQAEDQAGTLARASAALDASAADAAITLEQFARAAALRDEAAREATRREEAMLDAQRAVDDQRAALGAWARQAYVDGGALGTSAGVYTLLAGGSTDDVATHRAWLERAGLSRVLVVGRLRAALAAQSLAADRARQAEDVAEAAAAQAATSAAARDAVLAQHRARLADLEVRLARTRDASSVAQAHVWRLQQAVVAGGGLGAAPVNRVTGEVGDCLGQDTSPYPNGRIPLTALCPLWGAAGWLRADAAYAFGRMSQAFAARWGAPICVADSYRSYLEQVRVRAERGGWAAVPGRSNHGWGTAVDLCGGVESFDSPAHAWLVLNGPLYGWFHPAWAERGGALPEPWHWEYAGQG